MLPHSKCGAILRLQFSRCSRKVSIINMLYSSYQIYISTLYRNVKGIHFVIIKNCFNLSHAESGGSAMVRMLELKDENSQRPDVERIESDVFDHVIRNMPAESSDKVAHLKNYDAMLRTMDKSLNVCGKDGCYCELISNGKVIWAPNKFNCTLYF